MLDASLYYREKLKGMTVDTHLEGLMREPFYLATLHGQKKRMILHALPRS